LNAKVSYSSTYYGAPIAILQKEGKFAQRGLQNVHLKNIESLLVG